MTGRQEVVGPLLDLTDANVESRRDDADLVEATGEVDDDLAATMVVDDFKLADVAVLHHDLQEANDDLGAGSEEDLALAPLLGIVDRFKGRSQTVHQHHGGSVFARERNRRLALFGSGMSCKQDGSSYQAHKVEDVGEIRGFSKLNTNSYLLFVNSERKRKNFRMENNNKTESSKTETTFARSFLL